MNTTATAQVVAIVSRDEVKFMEVAKCDKRGKMTLWDGSEWNARNGLRWGSSNPSRYSFGYKTQMMSKESGERTVAYRAEQAQKQDRLNQFKDGAKAISKALEIYYANDLDAARAKIAEARAELDKLEAAFA